MASTRRDGRAIGGRRLGDRRGAARHGRVRRRCGTTPVARCRGAESRPGDRPRADRCPPARRSGLGRLPGGQHAGAVGPAAAPPHRHLRRAAPDPARTLRRRALRRRHGPVRGRLRGGGTDPTRPGGVARCRPRPGFGAESAGVAGVPDVPRASRARGALRARRWPARRSDRSHDQRSRHLRVRAHAGVGRRARLGPRRDRRAHRRPERSRHPILQPRSPRRLRGRAGRAPRARRRRRPVLVRRPATPSSDRGRHAGRRERVRIRDRPSGPGAVAAVPRR